MNPRSPGHIQTQVKHLVNSYLTSIHILIDLLYLSDNGIWVDTKSGRIEPCYLKDYLLNSISDLAIYRTQNNFDEAHHLFKFTAYPSQQIRHMPIPCFDLQKLS